MTKLKIDMKEGTAYIAGGPYVQSYYFRSKFKDGCILAWYSDTPCGRCEDQEQGWVVIDPKQKSIVDSVETVSMGEATGEYRDWIKEVRKEHGPTVKVFRDDSGDLLWCKSRDT